jgi:uncharacterized protein YbaP (TraB family)
VRRILAPVLAALSLALALPACAQPAPAPAPRDADPALWVVRDEDTTIYLFGTIHVLKPGLSWFDEAVKTAFDASQTLVLEMVEPDEATQQRIVAERAITVDGPTLSAQLSPAARAAFARALADNGLPQPAFDRMRPWFAAVSLSLAPLVRAGYVPQNGPETVLADAARAAGKPVEGLETFEGQIAIFAGLSPEAQRDLLESTLEELPEAPETMARMVRDWSAGDPDALAAEMNASLRDLPVVAAALLTDRNRAWAAWIKARMARPGTVFVAVGAGHLAGKGSVQDQLVAHRLRAERVSY